MNFKGIVAEIQQHTQYSSCPGTLSVRVMGIGDGMGASNQISPVLIYFIPFGTCATAPGAKEAPVVVS